MVMSVAMWVVVMTMLSRRGEERRQFCVESSLGVRLVGVVKTSVIGYNSMRIE